MSKKKNKINDGHYLELMDRLHVLMSNLDTHIASHPLTENEPDIKKKISKAFKGRELSESHKRKIGESNKGKPRHTEESLERLRKMQQDSKGKPRKPHSEDTKEKISKATKGRIPWNKGIKNSEVCGGKNPRAKRIEFEGTIYECIKDALKSTGRTRQYVLKYATYL